MGNRSVRNGALRLAKVDASLLLASEFLFVALPLLVLLIVLWVQGRTSEILVAPEWSFGAAVLVGQTVVRVVGFSASTPERARPQRIAVTVTILIVLGLVPALLVLGLALVAESSFARIAIAQSVVFFWAVLLFFGVGHAAQLGMDKPGLLRKLKQLGKDQ